MTIKSVPEFLVDATNVYRTKGYIVKQQITLAGSVDVSARKEGGTGVQRISARI